MSDLISKSAERARRAESRAGSGGARPKARGKSAAAAGSGGKAGAAGSVKTRQTGPGSAPREVVIIGGLWKRSKLPVADRPGLRPTPARVRETLFNWLTHFGGGSLDGWRCLDAYAGTGALGFEAASRGATDVVLLERDPALLKTLRTVAEKLKTQAVRSETADALAWMARSSPARFDVVFLDPPFDADELVAPSILAARRLLAPGGVIYLEGPRAATPDAIAAMGLEIVRQGRAGAVHYHLLQTASEPGSASRDDRTPDVDSGSSASDA